MIRCICLSGAHRKSMASIGLALIGAITATGALAQSVTQTLTLTFPAAAPVPVGGWTAVAIAALLAVVGGVLLRRRSATGAWFWSAALLGTSALLALQPIRSAEALIPTTPLTLITSPASVQFVFPGAPDPVNVLVTNGTGGTTTILSITLSPGPLGMAGSLNPCTVGLVLAVGATCTIGLSS
jgi:hypothetical protein